MIQKKWRWPHYFVVTAVCLYLSLAVGSVQAHAVPVTSSPRPNEIIDTAPAELSIRFNEPVVPELSRISVLTQVGQALEVGPVQPLDDENRILGVTLPALEDGAYLVSWQALSAVDGHTTSGSFSFGLGVTELTAVSQDVSVTAQLSPLSAAARWLMLTGIALVLGLFVFRLLVWNPIVKNVELEPDESEVNWAHGRVGVKIAFIGLGLLALGSLLIFIDQNSTYALFQAGNMQTWLGTRFGSMWLVRLVLTAVLGILLFQLWRRLTRHSAAPTGWYWWVGLIVAVGLAGATALVSHSAALERDTGQAMAVDLAHILAAAIWVGGLVYLALGLWQCRRLPAEGRTWFNLSLILNFSALAALAVGILISSGGYLAGQHVGSWTKLVGTAYGRALLLKLALALLAFLIAGVNLLVIKPRLQAAYEQPDSATATTTMRRFRLLVMAEALLALLILVAAGVLTDLQRGEDAPLLSDAPGQTTVNQTADSINVELTIEPALVGANTFEVYLTDTAGEPIAEATAVDFRFTFLDQAIGASSAEATSIGNGRYQLEGSYISLIGSWQVEVAIRRPGAFDTFAPYRLEAGLGGNIRSIESGARPLEQFAKLMTLAGGLGTGTILVLFAIGWGFIATKTAKSEWQLIPLLLICLVALWVGASQIMDFFGQEFTPGKFTTNPILPDVESIATGQAMFEENCVTCHGLAGRGDGPVALTLNPPPADFGAGHTDIHTDGDLYFWIREGIEDTPMPAFGEQFTTEETWHLVNYVRRLAAQAQSGQSP